MKVELLYFDGCPSYERLLPRLRQLVAEADPGSEIELRRIESIEDAERERFLGSPTVRVDGVDVDPGSDGRQDYGFKCRLYRSDGNTAPVLPEKWIRAALTGAGPSGRPRASRLRRKNLKGGLMPTTIDRREVQRLLAEEEHAQVVEVLPEAEFEDEHLPGAINIPLKQLDRERGRQLERERPVIVYCYDYQ